MIEKLKLELPEEELKDILDQCEDTLRNPPNEVRHIVREEVAGSRYLPNVLRGRCKYLKTKLPTRLTSYLVWLWEV